MSDRRQPLPVLDPGLTADADTAQDACCEACATRDRSLDEGQAGASSRSIRSPRSTRTWVGLGRGRPSTGREADRRVTLVGLSLAAGFVGLALAAALVPVSVRRGVWLPLHLVLAGGASVAIGAVLPFFVAALAMARPAPAPPRLAVIGLLSSGTLAVTVGIGAGLAPLATAGGLTFIAGLGGLGALIAVILRGSLGSPRGIHALIYWLAIGQVIVGASLATLFVGGWAPIVGAWGAVRPAHAWLNLLGFVGLVITATLVHLYPTVLGTRIVRRRSATIALAGLGTGPLAVALGYLLAADLLARAGALVTIGAAAGLGLYVAQSWRARGRWTTDAAWHRYVVGSLTMAAGWYGVAVGLAAGRVLVFGSAPAGWSLEVFVAPFALGFVVQSLTGAWTHLLPSIGPGDQSRHAGQRRVLATAAGLRLVALNAGTVLLAVGLPVRAPELTAVGAALAGLALSGSLGLFGRAVLGRRDPPAEPARQAREAGA